MRKKILILLTIVLSILQLAAFAANRTNCGECRFSGTGAGDTAAVLDRDSALPFNEGNILDPLISSCNKILPVAWRAQELLYQIRALEKKGEEDPDLVNLYKYNLRRVLNWSDETSKFIIKDLKAGSVVSMKTFSAYYKSKKHYERSHLYNVVDQLLVAVGLMIVEGTLPKPVAECVKIGKEGGLVDEWGNEYFPGHGYADPEYYYRKGRELESEPQESYWKEEKKTFQTLEATTCEITLGLLDVLKKSDKVSDLRWSEPYEKMINFVPTICVKAYFKALAKITTVSKKKYTVNKVWFELMRIDILMTGSSRWEIVGKTYEMHEFYAHQEVVTPTGLTTSPGAATGTNTGAVLTK